MPYRLCFLPAVRVALLLCSTLVLGAGTCGGSDDDRDDNGGGGGGDPCAVAGTCGGGSAGGSGAADGASGGDVDVIDSGLRDAAWVVFEAEVVERVNALRAQGGTCGVGGTAQSFPPSRALRVDSKLVAAARGHADDMAARNYVAHEGIDGRTPFERMEDTGYTGFAGGENIAAGQTTPAEVVEGWRLSPGHCRNLYEPRFNEVGVGYTFALGNRYGHYWVQNFGIR
jgi:hypothetical protein